MKCSGKVGYFFNLKKEYGEKRATTLLRTLEEEKTVQGAFITDFVKVDYLNLTKILLFLVRTNKVETSFDGLYVDGEYAHLLTHRGVVVPQGAEAERKEEKCSTGVNTEQLDSEQLNSEQLCSEQLNSEQLNSEQLNSEQLCAEQLNSEQLNSEQLCAEQLNSEQLCAEQLNSEQLKRVETRKEKHQSGERPTVEGNPSGATTLINHSGGSYEKIIIQNSELLNAGDIMKHDGEVENMDKTTYYLNPCSVLSAYFLDVQKNENVLDMCASPGGKSLVIANQLFGYDSSPLKRIKNMEYLKDGSIQITCSLDMVNYYTTNRQGFFVANEFNRVRYDRLKQVLSKHLPKDLLTSNNFHVTNYNGLNVNSFLRFQRFHKILLDVPCSTDEHLIKKKKNDLLNKWTDKVIKNNASVQFELLNNSFQLLHTNGTLVYSTCALSHQENDHVIEKLLKKYKKQVQIVDFVKEEYQKRFSRDDCDRLFSALFAGQPVEEDPTHDVTLSRGQQNSDRCTNENVEGGIQHRVIPTGGDTPSSRDKPNTYFLSFFEKTKYGYISLPDRSPFGILYICKIRKI
ncbi:conserved Plasmodium protein, unknown function [Plasmodium knowlesi strain H]|uniref:NOL1/NOP2/Sun domain family member 4 n=3 Tax=Plasmodium knowlesi TaxID=5850 RepID=A0A5K1U649_PLAKH|nr:conserved Plasmodium protein, unknown function [Plasmodium knowlesi strain H]OTN65012.1 Uncharacterized protein PKNOH_S120127100 [Plasmodium knowlesi]CAA9988134.1 conserved Plasmodium protein, unknown function [Plasmodium knowlesi strain H]SBO20020.1 conserved Plasmodium protein, unknown function [Plasmodium knowlesi strain H]SBO20806.1 conserved Plasmodium protein, unknown function [Plasmodium knowlesi strain H]VVS77608.1 conserved Plasmodium protein, unknown function [Plasmodium knowlesi |eukprot:XP_002259110.1 hypothetical protein, conserved in Plasmodium species [Plasmodium knowlesi strain H]